jgi:hypothetical protein
MDLFEKKRFLIPIELMIVLAINLVVAVLGYYAIMMWGLLSGRGEDCQALMGGLSRVCCCPRPAVDAAPRPMLSRGPRWGPKE